MHRPWRQERALPTPSFLPLGRGMVEESKIRRLFMRDRKFVSTFSKKRETKLIKNFALNNRLLVIWKVSV